MKKEGGRREERKRHSAPLRIPWEKGEREGRLHLFSLLPIPRFGICGGENGKKKRKSEGRCEKRGIC